MVILLILYYLFHYILNSRFVIFIDLIYFPITLSIHSKLTLLSLLFRKMFAYRPLQILNIWYTYILMWLLLFSSCIKCHTIPFTGLTCPFKNDIGNIHPYTQRCTSYLISLKRALRKSERIYLSLKSSSSIASFIEKRKIYKLAISYAKSNCYTRVINNLASDNRQLFRLSNKLLSPPKPALLPSITNFLHSN